MIIRFSIKWWGQLRLLLPKILSVRKNKITCQLKKLYFEKLRKLYAEKIHVYASSNCDKIPHNAFYETIKLYKTASQIALLEPMKKIFNYRINFLCGIPQMTLLGVLEAWQRILEKIQQLRNLVLTFR